jgi:hypothetical protein
VRAGAGGVLRGVDPEADGRVREVRGFEGAGVADEPAGAGCSCSGGFGATSGSVGFQAAVEWQSAHVSGNRECPGKRLPS